MDIKPEFGFKELFHHVIGDMAKAICERKGETQSQQYVRSQAAVHMILGFLPRDVIEAMLAGHCVMFHELMVDSVHDMLRGEIGTMRRATRGAIVAMDKAFGNNLRSLERYQLRPAEGRRDEPEQPAEIAGQGSSAAPRSVVREPDPVADVPPRTTLAPAAQAQDAPSQDSPAKAVQSVEVAAPHVVAETPATVIQSEATAVNIAKSGLQHRPLAEAIAACRASPEAMSALDAGDAARFARAMGVAMPNEAFLSAAARKGSPFDRHGASARAAAITSGRVKV